MNRIPKKRRVSAFLLSIAILISLAACGGSPQPTDMSSEPDTIGETQPAQPREYIFINTLPELVIDTRFPRLTGQVREKHELNDHTVGWLQIPGTATDEEVLLYSAPDDNNNYYVRKGFDRLYSWQGVLYSDFRGQFGDGAKEELLSNTVIYGHNLGPGYEAVKFGPVMNFTSEEFARRTPYIFFSTMKEDLVWEVFAVFYATVNLPYNIPTLPTDQFAEIIDESRKRSLYNYDTQVAATDKIITLSTCCYSVPGIGKVPYPSEYRFVVMAKLVDKSEATLETAAFEINPSPKAP